MQPAHERITLSCIVTPSCKWGDGASIPLSSMVIIPRSRTRPRIEGVSPSGIKGDELYGKGGETLMSSPFPMGCVDSPRACIQVMIRIPPEAGFTIIHTRSSNNLYGNSDDIRESALDPTYHPTEISLIVDTIPLWLVSFPAGCLRYTSDVPQIASGMLADAQPMPIRSIHER